MSDCACQNKVKVTTLFFMLKNMKNANEYLEQAEFVFFFWQTWARIQVDGVT